ncbi:hypothetical protein GCM10027589_25860 [Actinocorallia lasiicapitis]
MIGLGVHFALTPEQEDALHATVDETAVVALLDRIEAADGDLVESDQAWDVIHRCLTDGTLDGDAYPLSLAVLGGEEFLSDTDGTVAYIAPHEVKDVASALSTWSLDTFTARYRALPDDFPGALDDDGLAYAWEHFEELRAFFDRTAAAGHAALFTMGV